MCGVVDVAGAAQSAAPASCGGRHPGFDPDIREILPVGGFTPGVEPLNVIISACSNVTLSDIQDSLSGWDSVDSPACLSTEQENAYGS